MIIDEPSLGLAPMIVKQIFQIIRDINQYVQTTQIPADDGTVGLFVAGSQPLLLGQRASKQAQITPVGRQGVL